MQVGKLPVSTKSARAAEMSGPSAPTGAPASGLAGPRRWRVRQRRWRRGKAGRRQPLAAYLLLSPALALYIAFIGIPLVGIVLISFVQWDLITPPHFVGFGNFRAVAHDPQLGETLSNTFLFDIMTTAIHLVLGLGLALAVTSVRSRVIRYWARTAIVTPFLMSAGVVALMWSYIMAGNTGPLNYYLARLGFHPPDWLASGTWSLPALVIIDVWATIGFTFIIFLVGLQSIPAELYEAASIDGANALARFRRITLPMLSPATFIASLTAFIGAFEIFTWPLIDTNGGPGIATQTVLLYIYRDAFQNYQFGYSAVVSLINVGILVSFVVVMGLLARRWVHYERVLGMRHRFCKWPPCGHVQEVRRSWPRLLVMSSRRLRRPVPGGGTLRRRSGFSCPFSLCWGAWPCCCRWHGSCFNRSRCRATSRRLRPSGSRRSSPSAVTGPSFQPRHSC
jgi:multiple sugar transport system permease protein